ncbi:AAA family ATPase [Athalassotoga saccharophila]|uniref:AAA family ATPase n=1 Tax=Athalassotoga saccharophila TaxID=1441386 RepID=UPI00137AF82C|nr:ATP-binding protein [Athalassotoga saccharophila]BBJ27196.1 archaeal ATPase [Athalassotoga saccharophila]
MENPFKFGMVVRGSDFCDREKEMTDLIQIINSGMSVTLISPRRYGKTSLIINLLDRLEGYKKVYIDLMSVVSLNSFLEKYSTEILNSAGGLKKFINKLNRMIKISGKISLDIGNLKLEIDVDPNAVDDVEKIIELPSKIDGKFVIVIDEFQEVMNVTEIDLISILRKKFQFFQNTVFIFSGSKSSIMREIFANPSKPFYRFSQIYELQNLGEESKKFIMDKFRSSGVEIEDETFEKIYEITKGHAYYLQALSYHLWFLVREKKKAEVSDVYGALKKVIFGEKAAFESLWDDLTPNQKKVLKILSRDLSPYSARLSAGSVNRALESLKKIDLVDKNGEFRITDPIFKAWLRSYE